MGQLFAFIASIVFAFFKVIKKNIIIHNIGELFIYGGLAAIFVPIFNIKSISIFLVIISVYDYIAVRKTGHMIKLVKFQTKLRLFAGVLIPYGKGVAILGGGDIGLPLLFAGVVMKSYGFNALIISFFAALSLLYLFWVADKKKFYPAMPFITAGCFLGYAVLKLFFCSPHLRVFLCNYQEQYLIRYFLIFLLLITTKKTKNLFDFVNRQLLFQIYQCFSLFLLIHPLYYF